MAPGSSKDVVVRVDHDVMPWLQSFGTEVYANSETNPVYERAMWAMWTVEMVQKWKYKHEVQTSSLH
ncbi:uncharacterized protein N7477_008649 [Penicillium maclennaniae]|uniref:uncharacterized protein n=1 Tax=Penicillium maclennaniae TaxID=1343394 RepID=UPI0025413141|nr:uncharacterized protein N7477_008649 [Penicillium maclennaniae]KAJ5666201.1 hypothetical protein N7477_008649 [Penicillium maclennaniae]